MALKHTAPSAAPAPSGPPSPLYEHIVEDVVAGARPLMERIAEATRMSLQQRLDQARTPGEHHAMLEARQQLMRLTPVICERYPEALRKALSQQSALKEEKATRSLFSVHFDELELMDETQISDSVERARARQVLASAVEGPLADLDALVCAALGLPQVRPEHNPLRPDAFLQALQTVVSQMQVTEQVRHDWMGQMAQTLGKELRALYVAQTERLKQSGVQPVGYAMRQANGQYVYVAPTEGGASPGFGFESGPAHDVGPLDPVDHPAPVAADPLLTLGRLRRLLLGELDEPTAPEQAPAAPETFAERFSREFEHPDSLPRIDPPATDFAMTVPAAFEALQEMNQVGQMMERLGSQRAQAAGSADTGTADAPATPPRQHTGGLAQALSTEVVALMVDNIARDTRLLWPVQQFIRALEPALMQLALTDTRFFSHKEHAARRLLQDITDRSLAFDSTEAPGFQSFMRSLMNIAGPLSTATVEGPEDFEQVLQQLHAKWAQKEQARKQERQRAIEALEHAERRHLLAAQISREIWLLPDIGKVPDALSRFLLGPWAQVMAEARLADTTHSTDPGRYHELVEALIWSTQPELTRKNTGQLARLLPKLLAKLREGLASIDYPAERTDAVFALLMQLHQQAFKPAPRAAGSATGVAPRAAAPRAEPPAPALPQPTPLGDDDPWVAPSEAKESGFMESSQAPETESPGLAPTPAPASGGAQALAIGSWVNLLVAGRWERTQLSWIGSHGNLFLFTSASGHTQSMTLRLVDRLIQQGAMHIIAQQPVVDGALDAVAAAAMRNSVESRH